MGKVGIFAPRLVVALAAAVASAHPAVALEVDLGSAVATALERNPGLKAVEERSTEVAAGIAEARADAYPQLAFLTSWSRSRNPAFLNSPDFEDLLDLFPEGGFEPGVQQLNNLSLELSQPLYTFGKVGAALEVARKVAGFTDAQIATARLDTALAAAEAYFEVLATRQALVTVEEQEKARRESLAVVEARFEIGEATRLELLQSQATLAELLPALATADGRLAEARARLRGVLGLALREPRSSTYQVSPSRKKRWRASSR